MLSLNDFWRVFVSTQHYIISTTIAHHPIGYVRNSSNRVGINFKSRFYISIILHTQCKIYWKKPSICCYISIFVHLQIQGAREKYVKMKDLLQIKLQSIFR